MEKEQIVKAITELRSKAKERKFIQSIDLAIGIKDVNLKDPAKRFRGEIIIPHGINKPVALCVIGTEDIINKAKEAGVKYTLNEEEIEHFTRNPLEAKSFVSGIDYFLSIPQMMASVGKNLGRFLGPAGKMPSVLPPGADIAVFAARYNKTVRIRLRQNPVIHCRVASENMSDDEIIANVEAVLSDVEHRLENGANNIKHVFVKTTMGPPIRIGA